MRGVRAGIALLALIPLLALACPTKAAAGASTSQAAVQQFREAVGKRDFGAAVAITVPGLDERARAELEADFRGRLTDGLPEDFSLDTRQVDGRYFVVPPRFGETVAW